MISQLQSTDPEQTGKEEGYRRKHGTLWKGEIEKNLREGCGEWAQEKQGSVGEAEKVQCREEQKGALGS